MTVQQKKNVIINVIFWAMCIALIFVILKYFIEWVMPFIIAFIFAALLRRPILFITEKTKINRKVCSAVLVLVTFSAFLLLVWLLSSVIVRQLSSLIGQLPDFAQNVLPSIFANVSASLSRVVHRFPSDVAASITGMLNGLTGNIQSSVFDIAKEAGAVLASFTASRLPGFFITLLVTIISCVFITVDYENIRAFIKRQIPERFQQAAASTKGFFVLNIGKMLKAYLLLMFITFVELSVFLTVFGVRYSIAIAALISVVDILPVLGTGTVLIPWSLIMLLLGDWPMALCLIVAYAVVAVVRNFLEPKLVSAQIGLHPAVTLMSMYLGFKLIGFAGMLLLPLLILILNRLQKTGYIKLWR